MRVSLGLEPRPPHSPSRASHLLSGELCLVEVMAQNIGERRCSFSPFFSEQTSAHDIQGREGHFVPL